MPPRFRCLSFVAALLGFVLLSRLALAQDATLPPGAPLLPESALPEYEKTIDHARLIRGWDKASLARGEKIYQFHCHSCHGDLNLAGSIPNALRFAEGRFSHGADPLTLYRTLTQGWRLMAPQTQLVPREKYDVIHYVRETFLAKHNPSQYVAVTDAYLATLTPGDSTGPVPVKREPWRDMDYGPFLIGTFELADAARRAEAAKLPFAKLDSLTPDANVAYKGIAVRLDPGAGGVSAGKAWVVFEHDTARLAGAWTGEGFIDWDGINFNTRHVVHPRTIGEPQFETADGPGWANPATGTFDDARVVGADCRRYGPLPRAWLRYRGVFRLGQQTAVHYTVGDTAVLESHDLESLAGQPVIVRTLNVAKSSRDLILRVANAGTVAAASGPSALVLGGDERFVTLKIPASATPARIALRLAKAGTDRAPLEALAATAAAPRDLAPFTRGGPALWTEKIETPVVRSDAKGAFAWERFTLPQSNPWRARVRPGGFDFSPDGKTAYVCTWDGDVWRVDGIDAPDAETVSWRRMASGLFQPLGLKVRGNEIFVTCRDQLVVLRDLNGDGETDFYESVNSDHQVTDHFHEFAMGLQTDAAGNFYYAKSARHARTALVPQHGTLLKISADGATTEILANGFRAANGVCLNPDGSFFVTDQEGHWMPMNRINRITSPQFFGNMWSGGAPADTADSAMAPPLLWVDKATDRSPAELLWLNHAAWGPLDGALLNLSYGQGRLEIVVTDGTGATAQGALCRLPIPDFPTGIMRGRVHPTNGQLYLAGLSAWATSQTEQEGGFYRLRPTGKPAVLPTAWRVLPGALELTFSEPLSPATAADATRYGVKVWDLKRSANYGSPRLNQRPLPVTSAELLANPRTVRLAIPDLAPTHIIEITCRLPDATGAEVERVISGTIHRVLAAP
ncbi:MAG: c-type cytochrome [Opitutaceae bacterium]|nr:c-type cytochrome [Opitutaceae bacterium]